MIWYLKVWHEFRTNYIDLSLVACRIRGCGCRCVWIVGGDWLGFDNFKLDGKVDVMKLSCSRDKITERRFRDRAFLMIRKFANVNRILPYRRFSNIWKRFHVTYLKLNKLSSNNSFELSPRAPLQKLKQVGVFLFRKWSFIKIFTRICEYTQLSLLTLLYLYLMECFEDLKILLSGKLFLMKNYYRISILNILKLRCATGKNVHHRHRTDEKEGSRSGVVVRGGQHLFLSLFNASCPPAGWPRATGQKLLKAETASGTGHGSREPSRKRAVCCRYETDVAHFLTGRPILQS